MFCTRHTWFMDYRAQKCFVLLPSLTQTACKSPEPVAVPRKEAAYLTDKLYGNLNGNRWICLWPALVQHKWRFLRLGKNRPSMLSASYIWAAVKRLSVVLFLVLNSMHPQLCLSPNLPMLRGSLEMDKDYLYPSAKKQTICAWHSDGWNKLHYN